MKNNKNLKKILSPLPTISVSLLNSDLANLKQTVELVERAGVRLIHLDIMDGHFVPNLTFGAPVIKCLRKYSGCIFDVHLMIENPQKSISNYIEAGGDIIVVHFESVSRKQLLKIVSVVKKFGRFVGISIKPKTDVEKIFKYLPLVDLVLVMTVEPGFGGQKMLNNCVSKIKILNKYREENKLEFLISADGGINEGTIVEIINSGCDVPVVGNAIFSDKNFTKKIRFFNSLTKKLKFDNKKY
ncbi:MAG: ribulose-phosphate 3-epimerase [Endomicrobia bacterium]|nr:ribulose-phosphate 3-epimerase [Endomicrobiia bacterium]